MLNVSLQLAEVNVTTTFKLCRVVILRVVPKTTVPAGVYIMSQSDSHLRTFYSYISSVGFQRCSQTVVSLSLFCIGMCIDWHSECFCRLSSLKIVN